MDKSRLRLSDLCAERILVLDGAMATIIQSHGLDEADFRGTAFAAHPVSLQGCNDVLCLTQPQLIEDIHRQYLAAGADIIETNTFNSTTISLADYQLEPQVEAINRRAAEIARRAADAFATSDKPRFVAGSIGPTRTTLSLSPDVDKPDFRTHRFAEVVQDYYAQISGLVAGGVDLLLAETVFDTLTLKACLLAIQQHAADSGQTLPVIVSVTFSDLSYRTLSGQTAEAFWYAIEHFDLLAVGVNCGMAPIDMRPAIQELARLAPVPFCCYLNAGLPNELGGYDGTPQDSAQVMGAFAAEGLLNLVGGCCGTTPDHIAAIADAVADKDPRTPPMPPTLAHFSGMDPFVIHPESNFSMIGERTNVTGSRRFARLIKSGDYEAATEVARQQVAGGANIIDVNMDEGLLDSAQAMETFLNRIAAEPDIARTPIMVDSSNFAVIEAGLRCLQGKGIVNSISLKEGEESFIKHAQICRSYGAAVVVMAFDEKGQATTTDAKVAICQRAYRILIEAVGFAAHDIIFDPNILTIATGMAEHDAYAINFLEAIPLIKAACPGALISGGVSNISFSFRGNDYIRECIHAAFLYHAIQRGLDMGIVNAGQLTVYEKIPADLRILIEDVLFARDPEATERLIAFAAQFSGQATHHQADVSWREAPLADRLRHALLQGHTDYIEVDLDEALAQYPSPLAIIEGPMMDGMNEVGDLFGKGMMFLPQVVKSARSMKKAVAYLEPLMAADQQAARSRAGKILLATVKGDVHDIGKNIVGVVLGCNNYEIIDLGVMVSADQILRTAREQQVDIVGLSGLITPSLDEMVHVAAEMQRAGFDLPLLIGGATTSRKHTAIKIAPVYDFPTLHVIDASRAPGVVSQLLNADRREQLDAENRTEQERQRQAYVNQTRVLVPYATACTRRTPIAWDPADIATPEFTGQRHLLDIDLATIVPYIDWSPFFHTWELRGSYPQILDHERIGKQARELFADAQAMLAKALGENLLRAEVAYGFFAANSDEDDIVLYTAADRQRELLRLPTLRQQAQKRNENSPMYALADFIAPVSTKLADHIGCFAVTAGLGTAAQVALFQEDHDDYSAIMLEALADRLAEALAECIHQRARREWGYGANEHIAVADLHKEKYRGIRPAPGYPACPDHSQKRLLFNLLQVEAHTAMQLTENSALWPAASVAGFYFAHPQSRYFAVGKIDRDQVASYAERQGVDLAVTERWLAPNLGYEPN